MSWLSQFKLGRPGYEYTFSANPDQVNFDWERVSSDSFNLVGDLKERVFRTMRPTVQVDTKWFPKASDVDNFVSLLAVTDTFLAFIPRTSDFTQKLEPNVALTTTTVQIQNNSMTKLSAVYAASGLGSTPSGGTIGITGVFLAADGSGTNYWTGGSYADATRTITLGAAIPSVQQVFVTYTYPGWLVRMKKLSTPISGGRLDLFSAQFSLEGV